MWFRIDHDQLISFIIIDKLCTQICLQVRSKNKQNIRFLDFIGCFCDHFVVYLLPHQTHTWTNWCITFRTKRNSLCLTDIFHRIFFSTVRTVILINTAMQINHILTSCSLRQTKNTSCDNCLKKSFFFQLRHLQISFSWRYIKSA